MSLEDIQSIIFNDLNLCGCMDESALTLLLECLFYCKNLHEKIRSIEIELWDSMVQRLFSGNQGAAYCTFSLLDVASLIEHGASIRGSWLTEKGEVFLEGVTKYDNSTLLE